jgi:hypothetical protein
MTAIKVGEDERPITFPDDLAANGSTLACASHDGTVQLRLSGGGAAKG